MPSLDGARIFIPTLNRVGAQITWDNFSPELKKIAVLVCDDSEVEQHLKRGRTAIACPASGIAHVRQWITENATEREIIITDDDHDWLIRKSVDRYNLRECTTEEIDKLFADMFALLRDHHLVGVSARQGNNYHFPETVVFATRQCNVHGLVIPAFEHHGIRWDETPLMEDFHVTLSLLRKGHANALIADRAWSQKQSNAPGGCSTYRDAALQKAAAERLKELHPEFVAVVEKETKTGWDGMRERTDVRVAWKKAFHSAAR